MVFWSKEKSKKDGLDVLGKVGREQNMEERERMELRKHLPTNSLILKTLSGSEHGLWLAEFESDTILM